MAAVFSRLFSEIQQALIIHLHIIRYSDLEPASNRTHLAATPTFDLVVAKGYKVSKAPESWNETMFQPKHERKKKLQRQVSNNFCSTASLQSTTFEKLE